MKTRTAFEPCSPPRMGVPAIWCALMAMLLSISAAAAPQLPDFTYQGFLRQNGAPVSGDFDFTYSLYDAISDGNQVGVTVSIPSFPVVDGVFTQSLAFPGAFDGTQLWLEVTVNGVPVLPRQAVSTTPVAQFTLSGSTSGPAGGDLSGSYPNPTIANLAITNAKLASDSVSSSKIAPDAVTTNAIADDAVTLSKTVGGRATGTITISLSGGTCFDGQVSGVTGAEIGDIVVFNMRSSATVASNILIWPIKVSVPGSVYTRFCNVGSTPQSFTNEGVIIQTFR